MNDKVSNKFELTETTSYFVFLFPLTVLVFSILYMIIQDFSQFFLFLLIIIFLFIKSFLLFYNKNHNYIMFRFSLSYSTILPGSPQLTFSLYKPHTHG